MIGKAQYDQIIRLLNHFGWLREVSCFEKFIHYPEFETMFKQYLLQSENFILRNEFADQILKLICYDKNQLGLKQKINEDLLPLLFKFKIKMIKLLAFGLKELAYKHEDRSHKFYETLMSTIQCIDLTDIEKDIDFKSILEHFLEQLYSHTFSEKTQQDIDRSLYGILNILIILLKKFPKWRDEVGEKLTHFLLHKCLFEIPTSEKMIEESNSSAPYCKNLNTRTLAFKLVNVLSRNTAQNLKMTLDYLWNLHHGAVWRTKREGDWKITPSQFDKSTTGYLGINNLGCICYMISLLQQLFMVPSFSNQILAIEDPQKGKVEPKENLLYQL